MILYKFGEIVYKNKNNVILESQGTGYLLQVAEDSRYEVSQKIKMYFFEYQTDYCKNTFGFKDFKERILFMDLITIDKIGPRIALNILNHGWENVANLIVSENWQELSKFSFVNEKTAKLICVELKNKWSKLIQPKPENITQNNDKITDLIKTLSTLGFKKHQIDLALSEIKETNDLDQMIEDSIQIIASHQARSHV
ncbi:Holliday junction branch migration protein RuvA [Mycoplasmopsis gallopavonis]|uniref:Holliday junction branch migration complex subunit RuvA n=1 Tax=Mycoplasmopsis gallopavonis TaxID=76629 RepID=A0A449B0K6_9BACT|nr:Holliday junction branch migration protein RuvA [Mycoplasmopsis gallopavonis]RIV16762.1 Holliday junction branch migration protein RuvA [Mycoplasmopsis gallopavonis]VEU73257.1 Holliday junction DNA helicase RuvA [Mycoplasmopsis gallopavonis]